MSGDDRPRDRDIPIAVSDEKRKRLDEVTLALADSTRRSLIYHLDTVEVTDLETLAAKMAAAREEVPADEVSPEAHEKMEMNLLHTDLPQLADIGAIEFDRRSGDIRCRDFSGILEELVTVCESIETIEYTNG